MTTTRTLLSAAEFESSADAYEPFTKLADGEVVTMAPPAGQHWDIASALAGSLRRFVRQHQLGRVLFEAGSVLDDFTVRGPDVSFVAVGRTGDRPEEGWITGAPDLAIEVKSPGDSERDRLRKVGDYMEVGSNRFWVARPDLCTATVHSPDGVVTVIQFDQPRTSDDAGFSVSGFELRIAEESGW